MKIAYLALSEEFGGKTAGFTHASEMCEALASLGNEVALFIREGRKKKYSELENVKIRYVKKGFFDSLKEYSALKKELKEFDVIHERYSVNPYSCFLQKGLGKKYVLEVNDPGIETWQGIKKILYAPMIKMKFNACSTIITQTETSKKILQKQTGKPIYVVSNGVNLARFDVFSSLMLKERMEIAPNGEKIVAFIGSFREWHGVLDIPKIAEIVISKYKNVKFLTIGTGKETKQFNEIVEKKGLHNYFANKGETESEKVPLLLKASDVCIAPFSTKNFPQIEKLGFWWCPVKLFEYMAAGKPIVSFDFEEVRKIVQDSALLAKKGDIKEFAEKITRLLSDEPSAKELGRNGITIAEQNTWEKKARETLAIYGKIR